MASWISVDDRIKYGLKIVDQVENTKLRPLVNRICQSLESGVNENIFSKEELDKLLISLNLEKSDLNVLLNTIVSIFTQAAFHLVKSDIIENSMKEHFSIGNDKAAILAHAWITHAEEIIKAQKQKSIFPTKLDDLVWSVDIKVSSTALSREAKPHAKLQLIWENSEQPRLTVEMDKPKLWDLFNKLNDIQSKLDALENED